MKPVPPIARRSSVSSRIPTTPKVADEKKNARGVHDAARTTTTTRTCDLEDAVLGVVFSRNEKIHAQVATTDQFESDGEKDLRVSQNGLNSCEPMNDRV